MQLRQRFQTVYGNDAVIYPMLGVGAFFALFWVGIVVSHELGLSCFAFLVNGLLFAALGAALVARLECRAMAERARGRAPAATKAQGGPAAPVAAGVGAPLGVKGGGPGRARWSLRDVRV